MQGFRVRAAKAADIEAWHGKSLQHTVRAWVAEEDGEVIGMAGYYLPGGPPIVFSDMREGMKRHRKAILKEARRVMSEVRQPMFAMASQKEDGSERFLQWLGFVHYKTTPEGEVYLWPMR